jgi:hypothetical protein
MSFTAGVGRSCTAVRVSDWNAPESRVRFPASSRVGVGSSDDEDAGASVGSAGVGSSNNSPRRVIPQAGQVAEDVGQSEGNMTPDVLQHDEAGS